MEKLKKKTLPDRKRKIIKDGKIESYKNCLVF